MMGGKWQPASRRSGASISPRTSDVFPIRLATGETIDVVARSMFGGLMLHVYEMVATGPYAYDDNAGGGGFGYDARIVFRAPHAGVFYLQVSTITPPPGGYTLDVRRAASGSPLSTVHSRTPTPVAAQHWEVYEDIVFSRAVSTATRDHATGEYEEQPEAAWLVVRCSAADGLDIYVTWNQVVVETRTSVWATGATADADMLAWDPSASGSASFHPSPHAMLDWLLRQSAAGTEVHILSHGSDIGASFEVAGLRSALQSKDDWTCGGV